MMNGASLDNYSSAVALHAEFQKMFLAAGIVLLIIFAGWAIEEWRNRKATTVLGWFGAACLGMIGLGAAALITAGML